MAMPEIQARLFQPSEADRAVASDALAVKALMRVFAAWHMRADVSASLSGTSKRTWDRMRAGTWSGRLGQDQVLRASALVGLYKGLHLYFGDDLADDWVSLQNRGPLFRGQSPVAYMQAGGLPAIIGTRNYVDALRGGL